MTVTVLRIAIGVPGGGHDGGPCRVNADPYDLYLGPATVHPWTCDRGIRWSWRWKLQCVHAIKSVMF